MGTVVVETFIEAPIEVCFDSARDIDLHCRTAARTQERAVAGVTTGLIGLNDEVTFEAVHFGIRQRLTARITHFDRPFCFVDEMLRGAFHSLRHVHEFRVEGDGTVMKDSLVWTAPFGWIGRLTDWLFLEEYMRRFLQERNANLKQIVENASKSS